MAYESKRVLTPAEVDELAKAFNIAEDMYAAEQMHSGVGVLPYFWARNNQTG